MKTRLATALVLFAFCTGGARAQSTLPDLGDVSSASLSDSQERTIGNRIMREVRNDPQFLDDPEITDYITSLGQRLLSVADNPPPDITFFMVKDDSINAFAMVGGHVFIHSGLLLLTQDESELAGVMAHELSHILQKHQARMIRDASRGQWASMAALALALLASRSGGQSSGQITEAALAGATAFSIQNQIDYTREHEREADRVGFGLLERAGYDPRGMATFFERMLRANRLNEMKGTTPSYLRTHPMTTERIAEMQDRLEKMPSRILVPDSIEYKIAKARMRAQSGSSSEAINYFKLALEDATVLRPREDVYGLALAQRRAHDLEGAWKTLQPIRVQGRSQPAFEVLAGQILADMHKNDESIAVYRTALKTWSGYRALAYAYLDELLQTGRAKEALADLEERVRSRPDDWRLYELQSRGYEATNQGLSQHRAQAESYYRRGNLAAAVDQLELGVKFRKGNDFYENSIAEARLRELRAQLENERAAEKALKIS
ncbi:MAG TPA: M48 family metalloprotease [Usitatibacter sp.]